MEPPDAPQLESLLGRRVAALEKRTRWTPWLACLAACIGLTVGATFNLRGDPTLAARGNSARVPASRSVLHYHGLALAISAGPSGWGAGEVGISTVGLGWINWCRPTPTLPASTRSRTSQE
jgi:hypothetical protein